MMQSKKWVSVFFGLMFSCLLFIPAGALASKLMELYVTQGYTDQTLSIKTAPIENTNHPNAITWWYNSRTKQYDLFLPAGMDASKLTLWFSADDSVAVNGTVLTSGQNVNFLSPGNQVILTCGKKDYPLQVMQSENLSALFISTESGDMEYIHNKKGNEETGMLLMLSPDGSVIYDGPLEQVKGRGNSTFAFQKKPYQIKLDKSADLINAGKAKTWVLLADHRDHSLLRNKIGFALAQAVGLDFTSQGKSVDLYLNSEYVGTYLLCEKVEIGDNRIDIRDLGKATESENTQALDSFPRFGKNSYSLGKNKGYKIPNDPEDISGGYLLELDYLMRYKEDPSGFVTKRGQAVLIKEPNTASKSQVDYITAFFQNFENAVFAKDGIDPKTGKHYSEFVDMDSLVKKYLMEEVMKNYDGNRSSLYFYKPSDDQSLLAFAGPVWDYDSALGNYGNERNQRIQKPIYFSVCTDTGTPFYWFPKLYKHDDFYAAMLKTYYSEFVPALEVLLGIRNDPDGVLHSIAQYGEEIAASAAMNFVRWPVLGAKRQMDTGDTFSENITFLENFLNTRMDFLNDNWVQP